jgi:hypothetical protein
MKNDFLDIIRKANEEKWCLRPYCTACGAKEYRSSLHKLAGPLGGGLANAMEEVNPEDLASIPNWEDALLTAIIDLPISMQLEGVLMAWLTKVDHRSISFADYVLFKVIRALPKNSEIRGQWIQKCIALALECNDFSLIESLLLVLRHEALNCNELISAAKQHAQKSQQMRRVLLNACNLR